MKILLVDDDAFALRLLAHQLSALGHTDVLQRQCARDALLLLEGDTAGEHAITMVFCDLQMPGIDGVEFVRHLALMGYRGTLALISGEDERVLHTVRTLAVAHGVAVVGALPKPASPEQLRQVVAASAAHDRSAPAAQRAPVLPEDLRRAIEAGELVNHYQPKVDIASGELVGVEALVRWQRPGGALVYPDQFVGVAEEHGLIDALSHAVLCAALKQARHWNDAGLRLQVAVNVSMDNLAALDFPDTVARLAHECGVQADSLVLEVTESRLMQDVRAPLDILTRLRLKRIGLAIDDFGTGHSSLAQLRDIPFNELKLDRSFVNGAASTPALRTIVRATLAMAEQLGMTSVAEGVERSDDWELLRSLGCDVAQGYFVGRPMPGSQLGAWGMGWRARYRGLAHAREERRAH